QQHARHREADAHGEHAAVGGDRRGPGRADRTLSRPFADAASQPGCEGDTHRGPALRGTRLAAHGDARTRVERGNEPRRHEAYGDVHLLSPCPTWLRGL